MTFRRRVGGGLLYYLYLYLCKKAFSRNRPGTCFIRFQFNFARVGTCCCCYNNIAGVIIYFPALCSDISSDDKD